MEYTRQALQATGYVDSEVWDGAATSCCPPTPGNLKGAT